MALDGGLAHVQKRIKREEPSRSVTILPSLKLRPERRRRKLGLQSPPLKPQKDRRQRSDMRKSDAKKKFEPKRPERLHRKNPSALMISKSISAS